MTDSWTLFVIAGLAGVTLVTRCFFFILDRSWALPAWAHRALQYAPVAALAGVVVPEVVMTQGHLIDTWRDARLYAVAASTAYFFWRRGILGTIVSGMAVLVPLKLFLGW